MTSQGPLELDIKAKHPAQVYMWFAVMWLAGSGVAGGTSYQLAKEATEGTAREVAQATAEQHTRSLTAAVDALQVRMRSTEEARYATATDIRWIREALVEIKAELRRQERARQ